ncbi:unnamed protein product [Cylindrotheca closterium]|uniref:Uncharacterized protein n=1 Tax=Cylindrotheca closterium TaxID=2856 RepID=A0AAD2FQI7_9STRA|nr:unnamed protein product [Cylindrotheca closterium]
MFAMRESTNDDKIQKDTGAGVVDRRTMSFDTKPFLSFDDNAMVDDVLDLCAMVDDNRDAQPSPSGCFDNEIRDAPTLEHGDGFPCVEEPVMEFTGEDFGYMPFYPVDTQKGDDCLGLTPTYHPGPRFDGYQQPEVATSGFVPIAPHSNAPFSGYPVKEMKREESGFNSPFQNFNGTNVKHKMIQEPRAPVAAAPIPVRSADVALISSRAVSPSGGFPIEDYTGAWQQKHGSSDLDYFAEVIPQPNGAKTVSVPDLNLIDQHCVIKTQMGLAVLLNSKDPNSATISSLQQSVVVQQPGSNVLGVYHSNADNNSSRKFQRWSPEEDDILKTAVETEGGPPINWKRIASKYFSNVRSALQCKSRWTKSLKPGVIRGAWTPEEDASILRHKQEGLKWSEIAELLPGRIGEHVCDRYNNVLDPELKKTPWTTEEDCILFNEQRRLGNKWTQIAQLIPGRSENSVKNRWHNLKVTRQRRERSEKMARKRRTDHTCLAESLGKTVVSPSSNGNSPRGIVMAPPSDKNLLQEFGIAPPNNAPTIFRSTPNPTARLHQV